MIRIAYIDPHPVPSAITEALQILHTADALATLGADVTLITPAGKIPISARVLLGHEAAQTLRFLPCRDHRRRWYFPFSTHRVFLWQVRRLLKKIKPDVLYVRNLKLANQLLKLPDLPSLYFETHELFAQTFQEEYPERTRRQARKLLQLRTREQHVYQKCAGLFALTQALLDDIRSAYAITTPAVITPDGVDIAVAQQAPIGKSNPELPVLLYLGSLHPWKGVDLLIEALPRIPKGVLRIVGPGSARMTALANRARELRVSDRLQMPGSIAPEHRFDEIAKADICLLPSSDSSIGSRYTSPLKLFEYLALGKPVVAADLPAIREVVTHGVDAYLFPVGNAEALADAINTLLESPRTASEIGEKGGQLVERYTWKRRAETALTLMLDKPLGKHP